MPVDDRWANLRHDQAGLRAVLDALVVRLEGYPESPAVLTGGDGRGGVSCGNGDASCGVSGSGRNSRDSSRAVTAEEAARVSRTKRK